MLKCQSSSSLNRPKLLGILNQIGDQRNWDGANAEAVAIDFLNSDEDYLPGEIELSKKDWRKKLLLGPWVERNQITMASTPRRTCCLDVKVLSDKSKDLLDRIAKDATRAIPHPPFSLQARCLGLEYDSVEIDLSRIRRGFIARTMRRRARSGRLVQLRIFTSHRSAGTKGGQPGAGKWAHLDPNFCAKTERSPNISQQNFRKLLQ